VFTSFRDRAGGSLIARKKSKVEGGLREKKFFSARKENGQWGRRALHRQRRLKNAYLTRKKSKKTPEGEKSPREDESGERRGNFSIVEGETLVSCDSGERRNEHS